MRQIRLIIAALFVISPFAANAMVIAVGPFAGSLNENFESFTTGFQANPFSIMGGAASLGSTAAPFVYEPGVSDFFIGSPSIPAQVQDGVKGLGVNGGSATATINFANPVNAFGGYWGTGSPSNGFTISFFDTSNMLIDSLVVPYMRNGNFPNGDGGLDWHGWTSATSIASVQIFGDFVVFDALTATVPEPATLALLGLGLVGAGLARRRKKV